MYILQTSHMYSDPDIPPAEWSAIERLVMETESYCYNDNAALQTQDERWDQMVKLLREFCHKVLSMTKACLKITLSFKDENQLSRFISAFRQIAHNMQSIVVGKQLKEIQQRIASRKEIAKERRKVLQLLMQKVVSRIAIQLSIPRQHMLNFLKGTDEPNAVVTMVPKIGRQSPEASSDDIINFARPFKSYKLVYKELLKLVRYNNH